jgi:hypothetical protein
MMMKMMNLQYDDDDENSIQSFSLNCIIHLFFVTINFLCHQQDNGIGFVLVFLIIIKNELHVIDHQ